MSGLWPLGQRSLLVSLVEAAELADSGGVSSGAGSGGSGGAGAGSGVEAYAEMCCAAVEAMPLLAAAFATAHMPAGAWACGRASRGLNAPCPR